VVVVVAVVVVVVTAVVVLRGPCGIREAHDDRLVSVVAVIRTDAVVLSVLACPKFCRHAEARPLGHQLPIYEATNCTTDLQELYLSHYRDNIRLHSPVDARCLFCLIRSFRRFSCSMYLGGANVKSELVNVPYIST
jgi:hypothetical protein